MRTSQAKTACLLWQSMRDGLISANALSGNQTVLAFSSRSTRHGHTQEQQQRHEQFSVPLSLPIYCIWGANTGVGKTLISAGLASAVHNAEAACGYIKPVQTGFPDDSDAGLVAHVLQTEVHVGAHAQYLAPHLRLHASPGPHWAKVLYAWHHAVSPHVAVEKEGRPVTDSEIITSITTHLHSFTHHSTTHNRKAFALVETAGGVNSPGPSGRLQADLLRPLRLPAVLVGDSRLGGISTTLSAYESLLSRGYDVEAIVMMDSEGVGVKLDNHRFLEDHLRHAVHRFGRVPRVYAVPRCAERPSGFVPTEIEPLDPSLLQWLKDSRSMFGDIHQHLQERHDRRLQDLMEAGETASKNVWWPFTQHASLKPDAVQVIDSRCGEQWQVLSPAVSKETLSSTEGLANPSNEVISSKEDTQVALSTLHDGCSSWWTQTVRDDLHHEVVRALSYAAGRYLHVIFPENIHEPALHLTRRLLDTVGESWASRVFFSDDGSTAVEIALKMAFRKYATEQGLLNDTDIRMEVLGLHNAYHGDTLGAMDCVAGSVFNSRLQTPWYSGRGLFLEPPSVQLREGRWHVRMPDWLEAGHEVVFKTKEHVMSHDRDHTQLANTYRKHIISAIETHLQKENVVLGACIIEPLLQGAGGMVMVDPVFQRVMVQECHHRKIPVIVDEIFTGLWRLGQVTASDLLGITPDIACYGKLLTAGTVPMAVTLTSEEVFDAFKGPSKVHALLHGHSYTAHPIGCMAAVASLDLLQNPHLNPNICTPAVPGRCRNGGKCHGPCGKLLPMWEDLMINNLSHHPRVSGVVVLGTVVAVEMKSGVSGYGSNGSLEVVRKLRSMGVFARPLGNVVYIMCTPTTTHDKCKWLLESLVNAVNECGKNGEGDSMEEPAIV